MSAVDLPTRIRLYLSKCDPAISGQDGHGTAFKVACTLVNGFGLDEHAALNFLTEYNARCQPPWTEKELEHKIKSAATAAHEKPRGHLVGNAPAVTDYARNGHIAKPKPPAQEKPKLYRTDKPAEIPTAIDDGTRKFIMAAFSPGEGISISAAVLNAEEKCIPKGGGVTFSREEWIKKLDGKDGDPNKLFDEPNLCGAFIRINPMKPAGFKDADVTAFRHALMEFDHCSIEEQWNLITQSNIPCTAVLHSGNKSLHAWVKVEAKDRTEYAARVKALYEHFKDYGIDEKNKNPSRFSRLPGMLRGKKKQSLLALNIGAKTFDQWLIDRQADGIGELVSIDELLDFVPDQDQNTVLGRRWLCRGGSCLWVGQSGIGKSSLAMQAAIKWAMSRSFFGITPSWPLKSLFIQAENDKGDLAEMMQGVLEGMFDLSSLEAKEAYKAIKERIVIITDTTRTGREFAAASQRLIEKHRPDLVWVDPLLSFIGDDISSQKVCSQFLRNWLNPISQATGIIWMLMHHTGKPEKDPKSRKGWTNADYSYIGTGSSELVNWARAAVLLRQHDDQTFKLMLTKRGKRAGATDLDGIKTSDLFLKYSERGICWEQTDNPNPEEEEGKPGRKAKGFDYDAFLQSVNGEHFNATKLAQRASKFSGVSERTIYANVLPVLKSRMVLDKASETYSF